MTLTRPGLQIKTIQQTQVTQRGNFNAGGHEGALPWNSSCLAGVFFALSHSNICFVPCIKLRVLAFRYVFMV